MKKITFLFILLTTLWLSSFAQIKIDSTHVESSDNFSEKMKQEAVTTLQTIRVNGGNMLNNGYEIMVQQQKMYAWMYLAQGFAAIVCLLGFFWFYNKAAKDEKNKLVPAALCVILFLWTAYSFSTHYSLIFQGLFNPDYAAIKETIQLLKTTSR